MVEPFAITAGPGPFVRGIDAAQPMDARDWERLPLFRIPGGRLESWLELDAYTLIGSELERAATQLQRTEPPFEWWRDADERAYYEERPSLPEWLALEDCAEHWPRCRDRFIELLRTAAARDDAVLLVRSLPCDQGPIAGPLSDAWGWKV
jgi:hypothetical protein